MDITKQFSVSVVMPWHTFPREFVAGRCPYQRALKSFQPKSFRACTITPSPPPRSALPRVPRCHVHVFLTLQGCDSTGGNGGRRRRSPQPSGPRARGAAASGAPCRPAPRSPHGSIPLHYPGPNLGVSERVHQIVD